MLEFLLNSFILAQKDRNHRSVFRILHLQYFPLFFLLQHRLTLRKTIKNLMELIFIIFQNFYLFLFIYQRVKNLFHLHQLFSMAKLLMNFYHFFLAFLLLEFHLRSKINQLNLIHKSLMLVSYHLLFLLSITSHLYLKRNHLILLVGIVLDLRYFSIAHLFNFCNVAQYNKLDLARIRKDKNQLRLQMLIFLD